MFTESEIQQYKARYGDVLSEVTVILDNNKKESYIIAIPSQTVLECIADETAGVSDKIQINAASKTLLANCVIAGNKELIKMNGNVYTTLLAAINGLVKNYKVEIKKL
jgi:hypothetical protein